MYLYKEVVFESVFLAQQIRVSISPFFQNNSSIGDVHQQLAFCSIGLNIIWRNLSDWVALPRVGGLLLGFQCFVFWFGPSFSLSHSWIWWSCCSVPASLSFMPLIFHTPLQSWSWDVRVDGCLDPLFGFCLLVVVWILFFLLGLLVPDRFVPVPVHDYGWVCPLPAIVLCVFSDFYYKHNRPRWQKKKKTPKNVFT